MDAVDNVLTLVKEVFAQGLRKGYLGKRGLGEPGPFMTEWAGWLFKTFSTFLKVSSDRWNDKYADGYLFGKRSGGGLELVDVPVADGTIRTFMRVYIGAILDDKSLQELGIGSADVIDFLKQALAVAKGNARWDKTYEWRKGTWHYHCQPTTCIVDEYSGIPTFEVRERVLYYDQEAKSVEVCWHKFMFIEVK